MQEVEACGHSPGFGYKGETCEPRSVLAQGLFPKLVEYFIYSHLSYFLYIAAMLCCSEDEEFFNEDFF
jgi:hypothetical protein